MMPPASTDPSKKSWRRMPVFQPNQIAASQRRMRRMSRAVMRLSSSRGFIAALPAPNRQQDSTGGHGGQSECELFPTHGGGELSAQVLFNRGQRRRDFVLGQRSIR